LYRGFPETRRFCRPGKSCGISLINCHEFILFRDRSTDWRLGENWKVSLDPVSATVSMRHPLSDMCRRLFSKDKVFIDPNEVKSLFPRIRVVIVFDNGVEINES
jgi:hypothetical protein